MYLAQFSSYYYKKTFDENDYQPSQLAKVIEIENAGETMVRRKSKVMLRYRRPDKSVHPEKHAHHNLMLYNPFGNEK